jgi:hypothetical protein
VSVGPPEMFAYLQGEGGSKEALANRSSIVGRRQARRFRQGEEVERGEAI